MRHLILGGQRSGKSRAAEAAAASWLAGGGSHEAVLVATALPHDEEMRARIARHQADRAARVPGLASIEAPVALADALRAHAAVHRLVVIDCLTLWLTNLLMPLDDTPVPEAVLAHHVESLCAALAAAPGPVVLVSNEIGLGITPMSAEARRFVDELGRLHQQVAARCERVTLMVAGLPLAVKGQTHEP